MTSPEVAPSTAACKLFPGTTTWVAAWPAEQALTQSLGRLAQRYLKEFQQNILASDDSAVPPPLELEGPIIDTNSQIRTEELGAGCT